MMFLILCEIFLSLRHSGSVTRVPDDILLFPVFSKQWKEEYVQSL